MHSSVDRVQAHVFAQMDIMLIQIVKAVHVDSLYFKVSNNSG